jgi:TolB-like protein/Tfp pilus assembly protein PilF
MTGMPSLVSELKRRNVLRMAGLYLATAWLIVEVANTLLPIFDVPGWVNRAVVITLACGLVPALVFAWLYEFTPDGLKRESEVEPGESITPRTGKALDRGIMVVLALALGYFAVDKFVIAPRHVAELEAKQATAVAEAREQGSAEAFVKSYGDRSIAVMPFVNMSSDQEQEYFSDGISEELLNLLTQVPSLRVIARTSSFSYKGKEVTIAQIARELNVAHILEGSIRKSGNKIRVTAQLIRTADSSHVWSATYDRDLADIFKVQDEISAAVVAQLKIKLLGDAPRSKPVDPHAYAMFLQARQLDRQRSAESFAEAADLLRKALAITPDYAAAWDQLADVYIGQANDGLRPIDEGYTLAREAANKALALEPNFAPAHARLGRISMNFDSDLAAAARHYSDALALSSDDADIYRSASVLARSLGRLDTAIAMCRYVTSHDPVFANGHGNLAIAYRFAGRLDEAIDSARMALSLSPGYINGHYNVAVALLQKGQPQAAMEEIQQEPDKGSWGKIGLPMVLFALGRKAESDAALATLIHDEADGAAYNIAYVYAHRGDADKTFEWLEKARATHDPGLSGVAMEPLFANVQQDPRWPAFLRKLGRAPEQLSVIKFDVVIPATAAGAS